MPSTTKISLLALAGSAAAVPHVHNNMHARHDQYHHLSSKHTYKYAGPTGGWTAVNGTRPAPTAVASEGAKTTTIDTTSTSTTTVVSTVTIPRPKSDSVAAAASTGVAGATGPTGGAAACGPPTVYVTATEKVTVTVPAGGLSSSSVAASSDGGVFSILPVTPSSSGYVVVTSTNPASVPSKSAGAPSKPVDTATKPVDAPTQAPSQPPVASKPASSSVKQGDKPTSKAPEAPASSAPATSAPVSSTRASSSAAPSATPSSSVPATYAGGKRGLAYRWNAAAECKAIASKFKPGFAWNWEPETNGDIGDVPFIPTLRTLASANGWLNKVDAAVKKGAKVVFGFNEPDKEGQAAMSPTDACRAWRSNMNPIAQHKDVHIVGPSVSSDATSGKGLDWLTQFKKECPDAIYHSNNIHWYGYQKAGFKEFKEHVDKAISMFGKVWVTEFSLVDQSVAASKEFLEKALPYLDSNPNCLGYSYFAVGDFDPHYNMLGTGNTEVGKMYVSQ